MKISEIISNSYRYPLNKEKFKTIFVPFFLIGVAIAILTTHTEFTTFTSSYTPVDLVFHSSYGYGIHVNPLIDLIETAYYGFIYAAAIILFFACLILPGYLISVMKEGINQTGEIPAFDYSKNIYDTIKIIILSIIVMIIPGIITAVLSLLGGLAASSGNQSATIAIVLIISIINLIIRIVFELLLLIALMRFAKYEKIREAIKISELFDDLKEIGILKLIGTIIVLAIITSIIMVLGTLINLIPIIGGIVFGAIVLPIVLLAYYYALGSLYSEVA